MRVRWRGALIGLLVVLTPAASAGAGEVDPKPWPTFADETASRLVVAPALGAADVAEKDYAWGDVDRDGDVDLACVRKEPWNTTGRRRNVLFMNEGVAEGHADDGVLVDRTGVYASAATDGGQGMLDLTNDRDVVLIDLDDDGWLDLVTSTTYGAGLPKTISHPRVYVNLGEDAGVWLGFRYEEPRSPTLPTEPNFCGIGVGDVSGDGAPDLYFVEYNNTLEDRLWINDGTGSFADESTTRLTPQMLESDFGVHSVIADVNGDGVNDIVKDRGSTPVTPPLRVSITYNDPGNEGFFDAFEVIYTGNPYHVDVGDLNGDGRLDIVIDDDGIDRYLLNQGNGPDGRAEFVAQTFPPQSDLFGGNIVIRDVNQDGHNDVLIADVDVDCCGCDRQMHIWRNRGDVPNVTFVEATGGIPVAARTGTHDVAVFDVNGDGWHDMVIGTCTGMSVWIAQPELRISYPAGPPPDLVAPGVPTDLIVRIDELVGAQVASGTARLHASINGGPFEVSPMAPIGERLYTATLPAAGCADAIAYYVSVETTNGIELTDPVDAPTATYRAVALAGVAVSFSDEIEGGVAGWSVVSDPSLTSGAWGAAVPNGTIDLGHVAAPFEDATPGLGNDRAFVTENGPPGGSEAANDVDGGPTRLVSPVLDLAGTDATVSYARWFYCEDENAPGADFLTVEVTNDGATWIPVPAHTTGGTGGAWERVSFVVGDYVAPTLTVQVRFIVADSPNDSITEAGIDDVQVAECASCVGDLDHDGGVGFGDLTHLLNAWGVCPGCVADLTGDGLVGFADLTELLLAWGNCPDS